jgi:hypothetical protein
MKVKSVKVKPVKVKQVAKTYIPRAAETFFLSKDQFLAHFPSLEMTRDDFSRTFKVNYSTPQSLNDIFACVPGRNGKPLIKSPTDKRLLGKEQIIDLFYNIIVLNRQSYLTGIYFAYFAFDHPQTLNWADLPISNEVEGKKYISVQKNDASKRLIRNLFYSDILDTTRISNTVKSGVSFWQSFLNMFNRLELEDRFFAPSSLDLCFKDGRNLFYLFQAYQPKASIFNPYTIKWILSSVIDNVLGYPGETLFTPVLSWSAYLMAFMHSYYTSYVGVDVIPSVCEKNRQLADWYALPEKQIDIRCQPSEGLKHDRAFLSRYNAYFDTVMICPPYFNMEIYTGGEQSTETFPDYYTWLEGYWRPTVEACFAVSKVGGVFALIINDFQDLTGRKYALIQDLDFIVRQYYTYVDRYFLKNRTSPLRTTSKDRTEKLLIYKKMI